LPAAEGNAVGGANASKSNTRRISSTTSNDSFNEHGAHGANYPYLRSAIGAGVGVGRSPAAITISVHLSSTRQCKLHNETRINGRPKGIRDKTGATSVDYVDVDLGSPTSYRYTDPCITQFHSFIYRDQFLRPPQQGPGINPRNGRVD
jgi:hypothetical protein